MKVMIWSVKPYEMVDEKTGEPIIGKTCFYVTEYENEHPIKLSLKSDDDYFDQVDKPGLYNMESRIKVNSKNQSSLVPVSFKFLKAVEIQALFR